MTTQADTMEKIVALCRRRGFIFGSSEIYGGIGGFWDYGPLGTELKRNIKDAWWNDMVRNPPVGPNGTEFQMVGVDCSIIMNPKVWEASGHVGGFSDPMVDDKDTKQRFRADQIAGLWCVKAEAPDDESLHQAMEVVAERVAQEPPDATIIPESYEDLRTRMGKLLNIKNVSEVLSWGHGGDERRTHAHQLRTKNGDSFAVYLCDIVWDELPYPVTAIPSPYTGKRGSLTEPRAFNLMFRTHVGALEDATSLAYLRPETAQGIFANFRNVIDTTRVKLPLGIAQMGKSFRNEINPRNYTFRSREFEQYEIEFFCHPSEAAMWYEFWRDVRYRWYVDLGLKSDKLRLREHEGGELAHYARSCADVEYDFPFGLSELEGIANRTDFDLKAHMEKSGKDLSYFDDQRQERYIPFVIEPSGGVDRSVLAFIAEAYSFDESRASPEFMKFHPRLAPIKAAVFPLVAKDGLPEIGEPIYREIRKRFPCQYDPKQSIGKRYARMDEAGTPFCFTIDGQTKQDGTVTVRDRDTSHQERISADPQVILRFLADKLGL